MRTLKIASVFYCTYKLYLFIIISWLRHAVVNCGEKFHAEPESRQVGHFSAVVSERGGR